MPAQAGKGWMREAQRGGTWFATALAALVLLPLIAIAVVSAWFLEAERTALSAERDERSRQETLQAAAAVNQIVAEATQQLLAEIWRAYQTGGDDAVRSSVLGRPDILLATLQKEDGSRIFPPEQELLIFAEQSLFTQSRLLRNDARSRLMSAGDLTWAGDVSRDESRAVACSRVAQTLDLCLVFDVRPLRERAGVLIQQELAKIAGQIRLEQQTDLARESAADGTALAPPFTAWRLAASAPPAPDLSWFGLAAVLAPLLATIVATAAFVFWSQSRQRREDRARIEMLAQVSHELRTPLANFRLYGSLMADYKGSDPVIDRYCRIIEVETERLAAVIDNSLVCARDGQPLTSQSNRAIPDKIVQATLGRFAPLFSESNRITKELNAADEILFDSSAYQRILINLLDNARKHATGSPVLVRTELRDGKTLLIVADRGTGLTNELRDKLFSAFVSGDASSGFGLGLAACHALAKAAGGDIIYRDNAPGAIFELHLPVRPTAGRGSEQDRETIRCVS